MKRLGWFFLLTVGLSVVEGCATANRLALRRAPPCQGGVWMTARRGPTGVWSPGHWRCPE